MKYREKIKTRRGTIAGRNIRSLAFLGMFLIVGVCLIAGRILYERNIEVYTNYAYSDAHLIADSISGITPTKYLETQTKDAEYYDIRYTFMTAGIYQDEFRDFYLVVPTEDDLIYISEIYHNLPEGMEDLSKDQADFLEHKEYRPGEKEIMMDLIKRGRGEPDRELFMGLRELAGEKLATALVPIRAMDNEVQALVGVDLSVAAVWESLMNMYIMLAITIVAITCVGMIIHYRNLDRTLIQPITTLKNGTDELVNKLDSEEAFVSGIHTGDELEALAHSIEEMDRSLKHYVRENTAITAERERLNTELELAGSIQMDMLPCDFPPFPERSEFDLYASMNPAKEVGGDFYDFFLVDEDHLALVIADVSGKGIPGALFMMMVKIMVQNCVLAGLSPKQVMEQVNEQIAENNSESMFVTVWLGILDIPSGKLTAVNAGHEYPIFKKPGGCFELIKDKHGMAVGTMEGICYREYEMQFEPGSSLFVYSDGLPEANNRAEELFGMTRTLAALNENPDLSPEETLCAIERAVDTFVGDAPQFDDLTMLCFAYHGAAGRPETEERGEKENGQE